MRARDWRRQGGIMSVTLCIRPGDGGTIVAISGEVDVCTEAPLQALLRIIRERGAKLMLDVSGVSFMDCAGVENEKWTSDEVAHAWYRRSSCRWPARTPGRVIATLRELPDLPRFGQWATFLRNHDEIDLGRLTEEERQEAFRKFAPDPDMQLYHRGIRRRLAPMLGGDRRRLELGSQRDPEQPPPNFVSDSDYGNDVGLETLDVTGYGYRWIRLRRTVGT
jgi:hypothetical protein